MNVNWRNLGPITAMALALAASGCGKERTPTARDTGSRGLQLVVEQASVNADRRVEVTYRLANGKGEARDDTGVENRWTLARLGADPEGVPAYVALVRTGADVTVDGVTEKQPNFESNGTVTRLGDGRFRYVYATQLPEGYAASATYRVGVFSRVATGDGQFDADAPNVVFDFVPAGGTPQKREVVANEGCNTCHAEVRAHGDFRRGVQICTTCHTFQLYDPETRDPADTTRPNPLDLGRLVHRIHRGNDLPTVATAIAAAQAASGDARTAILADPQATYSVVGFQNTDFVFGGVPRPNTPGHPQILVENGVERFALAGVNLPQDIRNCAVCHRPEAPDAGQILAVPSKRTCRGCHVHIWFDSATPPVGPSGTAYYEPHPPVPGFPFVGSIPSATCVVCHGDGSPFVNARISVAHVEPHHSADYNPLTFTIVDVANAVAGQDPTVTFDVADKNGPITDLTVLDTMSLTMSGPTHEYSYVQNFLSVPVISGSGAAKTVNATPVAGTPGRYQLAFTDRTSGPFAGGKAIPAGASGTWAISLEGRRVNAALTASERAKGTLAATANFYDKPNNPVRYVAVAGGAVEERRTVVTIDRCNACHGVLSLHGGQRNDTKYCVFCHTYDATDWGTPALTGATAGRPKVDANGVVTVDLAKTPDNVEERSIQLKNMIHKIHTGESLELTRPFVIFGFRNSINYFDEVRVPPLGRMRCSSCHEGDSFLLESVPADSAPTISNETSTIMHTGTPSHAATENQNPAMRSACLSCHDTARAKEHADAFTAGLTERCRECHTEGKLASVRDVHRTP
ncbi:MAG TPA: OmcA/MtrC family decaheme c-type cytochrome [Anaeromyxobacteraceae bacterium]|nr:OmcA/MtrC family decaheme c-type cytochrome [Anaeromyxobacteraceae bacterium]